MYKFRTTFRSLSDKNFRLLWIGTLLIMAGFQMSMIAQGYWVYQETRSAKTLVLVTTLTAIPVLVFAPFGGAIADRVKRKQLLQVCQTIMASLALYIAVSISLGIMRWHHFLIVALCQGLIWCFNGPARAAFIPQIVGRQRSSNAIALISSGMSFASLAAPGIAGVLYAKFGADIVFYLVAILSLAGVASTSSIRIQEEATHKLVKTVRTDILDGMRYLWTNNSARILLTTCLVFMLLSSPLQYLLPMLVIDVYHRESEALGLLITMTGVGALIGTLLIASLGNKKRGQIFLLTGLLSGTGLLLVALIPIYQIATLLMVLIGMGNSGMWALGQVLVLGKVVNAYRGRVMSIFMLNFGLMPLVLIPAGIFADWWGVEKVIGTCGAILVLYAILSGTTLKKLRQIQ